jgi:hypothetical protein
MPQTGTTAPHRLSLSAAGYAYLVDRLELNMPPGWEPAAGDDTRTESAGLIRRGVLTGDGDLTTVHPSVAMNLRILAAPQIMLDTTATIGTAGRHSLHAISGSLGASLVALADRAVELSLFAATDLGRELIRAVPPGQDTGIGSTLGNGLPVEPPRGRVPLVALHELGVAELLRGADPDAPADVLAGLDLPPAEAELARQVAARTDGGLVCQVTGRVAGEVRWARVSWLHTEAGWSGIRPDPDGARRRMVLLEPVDRADLGAWVAPSVAEALADA